MELGQCLNQPRCAEQVDHAFEVVSQDGEGDFGASSAESSQQQARMAKDAVLQGSEGMLDDGAPELHQGRRGALVHALQGIVVQMARDHAACALSTKQSLS